MLREFRLKAAASAGLVESIVAKHGPRDGAGVPLLTSIDDPRDVATVRTARDGDPGAADRAERMALAPFVESWQLPKRYRPRIAEHAPAPPEHYRMAVTESGINDVKPNGDVVTPLGSTEPAAASPIALLWIGVPVGSHAGLMVLVGHHGEPPAAATAGWPLPLSADLGVRIYAGSGSSIEGRGEETKRESAKD